jgi:hypothetical protein
MTVEEYILIIAPQFTGVDLTGAISIAELRLAPNLCGDKRPLMVAYLAAHILTESNRTAGTDSNIDSLTEGGLSIKYSNVDVNVNDSYTGTRYGRELEKMLRGCIITPMTVNSYGN